MSDRPSLLSASVVFDYVYQRPEFLPTVKNYSALRHLLKSMQSSDHKIHPPVEFTRSAVLVPFLERNNETHLLFIRRSDAVRYHKGEISFPGGQRDSTDKTLADTAVRETGEETGIHSSQILLCGELDDVLTPYCFHITPFIGIIEHPIEYSINLREVTEIIELPLSCFFNRDFYRRGYRYYQNTLYTIHSFYCNGQRVWGITGKIVLNLLNRLVFTHEKYSETYLY